MEVSSPKIKNLLYYTTPTPKVFLETNFLYFAKWNFLIQKLKNFLYFCKKSFSYFLGNGLFFLENFLYLRRELSKLKKSKSLL